MNRIHDDLRARFGELRSAESAAAPDLSSVLRRVRREPLRASRHAAPVALVAAAAAIAALTLVVVRQRRFETPAKRPSIATWRSPTLSLVPATSQSVLAPPPLLSSVLDGATTSTLWRKGD